MAPKLKKLLLWLTALLAAVGLGLLAPGPASAATSYCGLSWGSLAKTGGQDLSPASVTDVRTGQHYCFDRMVVDLNGSVNGYTVSYVDEISQQGSGLPIDVRGRAHLQVTANAHASDQKGSTYNPGNRAELSNVTGYQTFRQVVYAGSFEGYTSLGLGVRARLPFRVLTLENQGSGSRLIVDVAHAW
jgi:hypothetical protein